MPEFFNGWRRKAGVVTLVLACLVAGLWARSSDGDIFRTSVFSRRHLLISARGNLSWWGWNGSAMPHPIWVRESWKSPYTFKNIQPDAPQSPHADLQMLILAPGVGSNWILPHWTLALPLTLLSAYLILWKPRMRGHGHKTKYDAFFWWSVLVGVLLYPVIAIFLPFYVILQLVRFGSKRLMTLISRRHPPIS